MKVRLDRLGDDPYAWQETLALKRQEIAHADVLELGEIACRGRLSRTASGFARSGTNKELLLEASLSYEQTLACTRCLGQIRSPVDIKIELLLLVEDESKRVDEHPQERELEEDDLGVLVLPGPHFDTRTLLVEQVQLNVPMKLLCRDDCAGLCPRCGAELNVGQCECQPEADPRWSALAKLKKQRDA